MTRPTPGIVILTRMKFLVFIAIAGIGCSSTAGIDNGGDVTLAGRGTLAGRVAIGPICPVEQEGVPCPVPPETYAGVDVLMRREADRGLAARVDLDDEGHYRMELPAGGYLVTLDHELGIDRGASPTHKVEIRAGQTVVVDFQIDTGIR